MVVVSLVVGIGIFRTPALVATATGSDGWFLAAWAIGGAVSLAGAFVFAEIGSRYPCAGGFYKVVAHCWHPMTAFLLNWAQVLMQGAGAAGVALIGSEYLIRLAGGGAPRPGATAWIAALLIGGLTTLNAAGIRPASNAQNVLSVAKIVLIAGLALAGLTLVTAAESVGSAPAGGTRTVPAGFVAGLVAVFYTYGGYQNTMNLGGDIREARGRIARSIGGGMAIVTALYLVINAAYVRALGIEGVAASPLVAADLSRVAFGRWGEAFVSLAIFFSAAGFVNATILHMPRTYVAMADDGLLPAVLGRLDPRTRAQRAGLAFFAVTALVPLVMLGTFESLLGYVMFTDALSLAVAASCLFVLRSRGEGGGRAWSIPGFPWLPAIYILVLVGIAADVAIRQTGLALTGLAIVLVGVPLYMMMRRRWGR
jgi:APA family basic amino acid/polyamine antiporter